MADSVLRGCSPDLCFERGSSVRHGWFLDGQKILVRQFLTREILQDWAHKANFILVDLSTGQVGR